MRRRHKRGMTKKDLRARYRTYKQQAEAQGREPLSFEEYEEVYIDHAEDMDDEPEDTLERSHK